MADVAVLGTGRMGAHVVRALRQAGLSVAVWNRTAGRAAALECAQVTAHPTAAGAVRAAPVVLTCLLDYAATRRVLDTAAEELPGRLLVQTSCGLPEEAEAAGARAEAMGARYLEAVLLCYPPELGTSRAHVPYAGPRRLYDDAAAVTGALGGGVHLGEDLRLVNAYYAAGCAFYYAVVGGALAAAGLGAATGLGPEPLERALAGRLGSLAETVRECLARVSARSYAVGHTSLRVHHEALGQLADLAGRCGVDGGFLEALHGRVGEAIALGHDGDHISVLAERPGGRGEGR
ncbi:NAD(P)-binding domain-containing protein [Actinomadura viridis]|uniref:3-hydroxyisobutyrate dehydrogenase-like beta-hydroxyacid dehydrogenase n=1 Tax=Actinomadura viridis TaxID=58110 RepID=A0A931DL63_9ACTN|nr:NAD(P)-binding domain-containing protein [Actinomadura viridis]MBG6091507.1 3-hydroxyisobutyrate dehydrogenase-like beta-hydroxyacid dehydrogenase [Actinomadura viridis]